MGISDFGEMTRLAQIARPDTCVITNIGTCHLENLGDRNGVLKAKTEIFKFLRPEGHIVLNGDDDKLITVKEYEKIKPVFFGMSNECQVYGDKIVSRGLKGMTCTIHLGDTAFTVDIPMPGRHMYIMRWQQLQLEIFTDLQLSRSKPESRAWSQSAVVSE